MAVVFDQNKAFEIPSNGLGYFDATGDLKLIIAAGDNDPIGTPAPIHSRYHRTNGEVWRKTGPGDNDWQNDDDISTIVGKIWSVDLFKGGGADNRYLTIGKDFSTNESQIVCPYDASLRAITVSNKKENSDVDIEIYRVPFGSGIGTTPRTPLVPILQLRDFRIFVKNDYASQNITVSPGDRIMVFTRKVADQADNLLLSMTWQITNDVALDAVENYSGKIEV